MGKYNWKDVFDPAHCLIAVGMAGIVGELLFGHVDRMEISIACFLGAIAIRLRG